MNVSVFVYQVRNEHVLEWTTLGLREPITRMGRSLTKLRQDITNTLRDRVSRAEAKELLAFMAPAGVRLERVHLEMSFRGTSRRWRAAGVFPLIVAPYPVNDEERLLVAYHPRRQEQWFPVDPAEALEAQATRYFQDVWADLPDLVLDRLRSDRKDSVGLLAFRGKPKDALSRIPAENIWADLETEEQAARRHEERVLRKLGTNLTARAVDGALGVGLPRPREREQMMAVLSPGKPKSVIVVGPPGSGKTMLIRQWIADMVEADGFPVHRNPDLLREVWQISGRHVIAGMSYVGEWQQRCLDLLDNIQARRHGRRYLYVDDIHGWGRLGRSRDSDSNFALFFQGAVARGDLTIVAECSAEQLQRLDEDAPGFVDHFSVVRLDRTDRLETLRMAIAEARELERRHRVRFDVATFAAIVDEGGSLLTSRAMPGIALDLMRDLARHHAVREGEPFELTAEHVTAFLSRRTGLPESLLRPKGALRPADVEAALTRQVAGQPAAVASATDVVLRIRGGLTDPRRPYAVYLFSGPTGTGKTELCRSLAAYLYGDESRLLRIDASEYATPDAVSRLVGDMGQPEGVLTNAVRAQPFGVVLFDEVEKAHPRVLNLLLQVFDEGRLTDAAGHVADFTHSLVVMTSNLGAQVRPPIGLGEQGADQMRLDVDRAIKEFFPPELFNRIDRVVHFSPLSPETSASVVEKELAKLLSRRGLTGRNVFVSADDNVKSIVVREAFDRRYGARPLKRWLEDHIGSRLADHLAKEPDATLQLMQISGIDGRILIDAHALRPAAQLRARWTLAALLDARIEDLRAQLPDARRRMEALQETEVVRTLSERIQEHLAGHNLGRREESDRVHDLERLRQQIADLASRLGATAEPSDDDREHLDLEKYDRRPDFPKYRWNNRLKPRTRRYAPRGIAETRFQTREQLLELLADVAFVERAVHFAEDDSQNACLIEIVRVGQPRQQGRFGKQGSQLADWLLKSYSGAFGRTESVALQWPDGSLHDSFWNSPRIEHVIMKRVGLGVRDFFEGEVGCHVWQSLGRLPEIVQVSVSAFTGIEPMQALQASIQRREQFRAARARGEPPPFADPFLPPPVVRTYRFEPPLRDGESSPIEIEDYLLGYVGHQRVQLLADGLARPWLLRRSRAADISEAP